MSSSKFNITRFFGCYQIKIFAIFFISNTL
jgi:hypothetical protein